MDHRSLLRSFSRASHRSESDLSSACAHNCDLCAIGMTLVTVGLAIDWLRPLSRTSAEHRVIERVPLRRSQAAAPLVNGNPSKNKRSR